MSETYTPQSTQAQPPVSPPSDTPIINPKDIPLPASPKLVPQIDEQSTMKPITKAMVDPATAFRAAGSITDKTQNYYPAPPYQPRYPHNRNPHSTPPSSIRDQAIIRDLQSLLASERKEKQELHSSITASLQAAVDDVLASSIQIQFHKDIELAKRSHALREKEIALEKRESLLRGLEEFLSQGQKVLKKQRDQGGEDVCVELKDAEVKMVREQVAVEMKTKYANADARLVAKLQEVRAREEKVEMLQETWKAQAKATLEKEIRGVVEVEIADRIAQTEFDLGVAHGKALKLEASTTQAHKSGFSAGYKTAYDSMNKLAAFRNGQLAPNSPELAFLFDPTHPQHPFNMGMHIGKEEVGMRGGNGGHGQQTYSAPGQYNQPGLDTPPTSDHNNYSYDLRNRSCEQSPPEAADSDEQAPEDDEDAEPDKHGQSPAKQGKLIEIENLIDLP